MVFRPNPGKFKELKRECNGFLESVRDIAEGIDIVKSLKVEEVTKQVHNWQVFFTPKFSLEKMAIFHMACGS